MTDEITRLTGELQQANTQIAELQHQLKKANTEISDLVQENQTLRDQLDNLEQENQSLRDQLEQTDTYVSDSKVWIAKVMSMNQDILTYLSRTAYQETKWKLAPEGTGRPLRYYYVGFKPCNTQYWLQDKDGDPVHQYIAGDMNSYQYQAEGSLGDVTFAYPEAAASRGTKSYQLEWKSFAAAVMYNFADFYYHADDLIYKFTKDNPPPKPPDPKPGALRE